MASEIQYRHDQTGETLYVVIVNDDPDSADYGKVWDAVAGEWVGLAVADWADYDIALAESPASSYRYVGTFPAAVDPLDVRVWLFVQGGGAVAIGDPLVAEIERYWDGTVLRKSTKAEEIILAIFANVATYDAEAGTFTVYARDGATVMAILTVTGSGTRTAPTLN